MYIIIFEAWTFLYLDSEYYLIKGSFNEDENFEGTSLLNSKFPPNLLLCCKFFKIDSKAILQMNTALDAEMNWLVFSKTLFRKRLKWI